MRIGDDFAITRRTDISRAADVPQAGSEALTNKMCTGCGTYRYLVSRSRGDSTWYELSHDTLIRPILDDNRKRLQPWQLVAREWSEDRQRTRLLAGPTLRAAQLNEESLNLTNDERNFLAESERAEKDRGTFHRIQRAVWRLRFVVVIETALIVVLLIILIAR